MLKQHTTCIVCGGRRLNEQFQVKGFTIVKCQDCTLVFVKEMLSSEDLADAYSLRDADYVFTDPANIENLKYYYIRLRALIENRIASGRILDVGCSQGHFLDVMEGWQRCGIEMAKDDAEVAHQKYGDCIQSCTFEDYKCSPSFFDVITMQDVLDHMIDPIAALKKCLVILKPGGLIAIKVHDISCLFAKLSGSRFSAIVPPYHLSYFNRTSLRMALGRAGFHFLFHRYIGHLLFLKTIPYRLARENHKSPFYKIYSQLDKSALGNIRVRKNLRDIITVVAEKPGKEPTCQADHGSLSSMILQ